MSKNDPDCGLNPIQSSTSIPMYPENTVPENVNNESSVSNDTIINLLNNMPKVARREFFDVDDCVSWVRNNHYNRIGLQFPDQLLPFASDIACWVEKESGAKTFILADTSYRSCCVDDVAAEHANVDCLIHYGDACLSEYSGRYPLRYVFGHLPVDVEDFKKTLGENSSKMSKTCLLLYDVMYSYASEELEKCASSVLSNVINARISTADFPLSLGRSIPDDFDQLLNVTLVFIGQESSPLLAMWLMIHVNCNKSFVYDPSTRISTFSDSRALRHLKKRLFLVEKVKDARTLGVVVCSLSVSGIKDAVERLRQLCNRADKKMYVLSIGKLNVPKLSNFASDIDAFIVLSCPYGILLNSSEHYRPVVSFFEAEVALNPAKEWAALYGWTTDYKSFLRDDIGETDKPDLSLITGRIRGLRVNYEPGNITSNEISLYSAGTYPGDKTWKGLDDTCTGEESTQLFEGRKGIASHYAFENL